MVMSVKWPKMACVFAIMLAFSTAGCAKYDVLERNMQYVSIDMLRKESLVAYERLGSAHAGWKASPGPDTLERFKNFYLQYAIIYNELMDRSGSRPVHHLHTFDTTMPPPPPGVTLEAPETAAPAEPQPVAASDEPESSVTPPAETTLAPPSAPAPIRTVAAEASPGAGSYLVRSGDTPHSIARQLGVSETALMQANTIAAPRQLQVGQQLVIPEK